MAKKPPVGDPVQDAPRVSAPRKAAAGLPAVGHTVAAAGAQMGARRAALTLLKVNQKDGFDCPGCAWPEPEHRHTFEFCENGAKALAFEATKFRVTREFFARHTVSELMDQTNHWLEMQGRLTEPMRYDAASDRYVPCKWDEAFELIGRHLRALESPHQAEFYTSGRTPNQRSKAGAA